MLAVDFWQHQRYIEYIFRRVGGLFGKRSCLVFAIAEDLSVLLLYDITNGTQEVIVTKDSVIPCCSYPML